MRALPLFLLLSSGSPALSHESGPLRYDWPHAEDSRPVEQALPLPPGLVRDPAEPDSFAHWIRNLPVKAANHAIRDWQGQEVLDQAFSYAIVDLDVRRWQECADVAMRLWAEFLWGRGEASRIRFKLEGGGPNPRLGGLRSDQRATLDALLSHQYQWASSAVLKRDLAQVPPAQVRPGDVVVLRRAGASQGHVFVILDVARNPSDGAAKVVLAHSNIPAQSFHVVPNPMPYVGWDTYRDELSFVPGTDPARFSLRCWHDWTTFLDHTRFDENGQGVVRRFQPGKDPPDAPIHRSVTAPPPPAP